MVISLELYSTLILTVLGFLLPILAILLSFFPDASRYLFSKYENERKQSEDNIIRETEKRDRKNGDLNYDELRRTLKTLKKKRKQAETRLGYLKPTKLIFKISLPLAVAFVGALGALQVQGYALIPALLFLASSLLAFGVGLYFLLTSILVLTEVAEIVSQKKAEKEDEMIRLLSILVEKASKDKSFLAAGDITVSFNDEELARGKNFEFSVNKKYDVPISIYNGGDKMGKKVEVGFHFLSNFLVEKNSGLSLYTGKDLQIVRFNTDELHVNARLNMKNMGITFLEPGEYKIYAFITGENVTYQSFYFRIKVIN